MSGWTRRMAVCAALLGAVTVSQSAEVEDSQDQLQPVGGLTFRDEIELTVVNLVVSVTDGDGNPVTDLTMDDFEVYQDGRLKPITNFQVYTEDVIKQYYASAPTLLPDAETPATEVSGFEPRPVYLVMYVDHYNLNPLDRNRVLSQMERFVRENVKPPVQMMVVSRLQTPQVIQDFTSDSAQVIEELRGMGKLSANRASLERNRGDIVQTMQSRENNPSNLNDPMLVRSQIKNLIQEETVSLQSSLGALREIITMLSGLEGKKAILYLSNGLPMVPGIDLFETYASTYRDDSAIAEAVSYDQSRLFDSIVAAANAQDVTFYTIDAGGLRAAGVATAEYTDSENMRAASIGRQNYLDTLRFIADGTGGLAIIDTNDVRTRLDRVEQDLYTYYSIGYPLQHSGTDKVHDIKVRLPAHPDYEVRYRRRVVEKSLTTRVQDKVVSSLRLAVDENPMDVQLTRGPAVPASSDRWAVPLKVSFPVSSVALVPESDAFVSRLVLFVAARDSGGGQSEVVQQNHEVRVPADSIERAQEHRFKIEVSLLMKEGSHTVSVGLLDQVTRQSSYQTIKTSVPTSD
ncbi:MAG TPA: VWA domain-containing protein [Chondromyces sp.]|nr:VWA domain-containing protein [Chondromyces sp.]